MKFHQRVPVVLFMLFFVLGPFGLPLLWKNPNFSKTWKWVITAVMLAYTAMLFYTINSTFNQYVKLLGKLT